MNYFVFDENGLGCERTPLPHPLCPSPTSAAVPPPRPHSNGLLKKEKKKKEIQTHLPTSLCSFIINEKPCQWNVKQEREMQLLGAIIILLSKVGAFCIQPSACEAVCARQQCCLPLTANC